MNTNNLYKQEKLYKKAIKKAEDRKKKGFYESAALAYLEANKFLPISEYLKIFMCLYNAGSYYGLAKKYKKSKLYLQKSLAISENLGKNKLLRAESLNMLGGAYVCLEEFTNAEKCYQEALIIKKKLLGETHPDIAILLNNVADLYDKKKDLKKSDEYYQKAKGTIGDSTQNNESLISKSITKNHKKLQQKVAQLEREKLEIQAALYQSKKLEYLGQMATMMAHNINNPIGIVRMIASGALGDLNDNLFDSETELKPLLEKIIQQTERLSVMMANFRKFAKGDRKQLTAVNLNALIEDIYQLLFVAPYQIDTIKTIKEFTEPEPIAHANEFALQEMLISLLSNAREAVKEKTNKQIKIETWQQKNTVGFNIEDSGEGISTEQQPQLFTPFLSSKSEGMGLGLYFCREIVKDLGGSIEYYQAELGGAGFKISLPIEEEKDNGI